MGPGVNAADSQDGDARARAWSRYWGRGVRHSCPGSFHDHYGAATQAFWRERFSQLNAEDRALELGCGNGSLIRYLDRACPVWPASIDAVDLAELDSQWLGQIAPALRDRVRLHPRTPAATLPLADASVTQVFSQYALEYFAGESCWRELARVMAPHATLALIAHHRESHLAHLAESESVDAQWLLAPGGPVDRAEALLPWLAMSADPAARAQRAADPRAAAARQAFNAVYAELDARIAAAAFPDLLRETADGVMRILQAAAGRGAAPSIDALRVLRAELEDNRLRVAELVACALDREGIERWQRQLQQIGCTQIEVGEISEQNHLFGWSLVARRG